MCVARHTGQKPRGIAHPGAPPVQKCRRVAEVIGERGRIGGQRGAVDTRFAGWAVLLQQFEHGALEQREAGDGLRQEPVGAGIASVNEV